ncbi:MAG: aminoglycoside 3'-phosphotransferase [Arthrobacter sp.]|nr:aminoglycoside 3'-phosphotransferase [Arthrobacter sp.]
MSVPPLEIPVPSTILELAGGRAVEPVWLNGAGALTVRAGSGPGAVYIKHGPLDPETSAAGEAARLAWAAPYTPVPRVLEHGSDGTHEWLVTEALPYANAVERRWLLDPGPAVRALGAGLRALHEALPVYGCPFDWGVASRLNRLPPGAAARLPEAPPIDRPVVCHGDACAPNTLLTESGDWAAHVDLGALGVADRWADLAVASANLERNYGPGWEPAFFAAYGVTPDAQRLAYYRALWDAGDPPSA